MNDNDPKQGSYSLVPVRGKLATGFEFFFFRSRLGVGKVEKYIFRCLLEISTCCSALLCSALLCRCHRIDRRVCVLVPYQMPRLKTPFTTSLPRCASVKKPSSCAPNLPPPLQSADATLPPPTFLLLSHPLLTTKRSLQDPNTHKHRTPPPHYPSPHPHPLHPPSTLPFPLLTKSTTRLSRPAARSSRWMRIVAAQSPIVSANSGSSVLFGGGSWVSLVWAGREEGGGRRGREGGFTWRLCGCSGRGGGAFWCGVLVVEMGGLLRVCGGMDGLEGLEGLDGLDG